MLVLDVLVEVPVADEGVAALVALVGPLPRVGVLVVLQVVHRVESLVAGVTLESFRILTKIKAID